MHDHDSHSSSRRSFLRGATTAAILSPAFGSLKANAQQDVVGDKSENISILSQIAIGQELYEHDSILKGSLRFRRRPTASILIQWIDSFGRIAAESTLPAPSSLAAPLAFSFDLRTGLTYINSIRVKVGGIVQAASTKFMRSPAPSAWDDYQIISWAHYPDGFYDQLRDVGVNATIAGRASDFSNVLDNNFDFYAEQLMWEVFAIYHKDLMMWRDTISKVRADRGNLEHWIRKPCLNDPETQKYVRDNLQKYVRRFRAFRPLYYTIADELGQADQVSANDFCHSPHCATAFAEYLRKTYGSIGQLSTEWQEEGLLRWDDESLKSGSDWERSKLMISRTTTDAAFEAVALANLVQRYGTVNRFNREYRTTFPEPHGGSMESRESWRPVLGLVRESLSVENLTESALEKALGPIDELNARCGNRAGWNAPQKPTSFKTWTEIKAFLVRYDKELGEVHSTKGWNIAPWSDFRNFMDSTFADSVLRAAATCKNEDPHARCATEGGQAPFAFGWYNYEQVVRAIDVIEPYNIGNNVEVIRSLKPEAFMLSTVSFGHKPGKPLTANDHIRQQQAIRPVWWELFHSHQGTIIWDNQEEQVTFVDLQSGQLTPSAETFRDVFRELRSGIGMLVMNGKRTHDGIAIHYSHPSVQAHWLLENVKKAREWMVNTVEGYVTSRFVAVRNSWTKLVEDLQVQYDFVSASQLAAGGLDSGKYRIFILPESIALSPAEAEQVRNFVRSGGTLVADFRTALLNEHCRDLGSGQLNEVFGITEGETRPVGATTAGVADEESLQFDGKVLDRVQPADTSITTTTGKALVRCGDVPMLIVNRFGAGRAVYLNMDLSGYGFERLNPKPDGAIPGIIDSILKTAQIRPRVRVTGPNGGRLPGTEVVILKNGVCEMVAVFRNPQFDDGGWGSYAERKWDWRDWSTTIDNSALESDAEVTIDWGSACPTYDIRGRKDLGTISTHRATLNPWEPLVFTRTPGALPPLRLAVPSSVKTGSELEITISSDGAHPEGSIRIVHIDMIKPSGGTYELYTRNVAVTSVPHKVRIPIAANDPTGTWKVHGHDLLSGQILEGSFSISQMA